MPAPTITPLPAAPLRSQAPGTFASQAETFVDALEDLPAEINAFIAWLETYSPPGGYTDAMARAAISIAPTAVTGTTHSITLGNAYGYLRATNEAGCAFTVPLNADHAFIVGTVITLRGQTSGAVTIAGASGVTLNPPGAAGGEGPFSFAEIGSVVQLKKVATDEWDLIGGLA
jgi:hypothetical protein